MTGTFAKTGEIRNSTQGGWIELGTITVDPASIAAAAQGIETTAVTGVLAGDQVFVSGRDLPLMAACVGAKVTATDVISLYFNNMYDATTASDIGSKVFDIMIFHTQS